MFTFQSGIPVIYILATVPSLMPWTDFRFLSWCHLIGSLAPWCGSFLYHLFMNLDQGQVVYYRLLKLDMFGIWMSQSFGKLQAFPIFAIVFHFNGWFFRRSYVCDGNGFLLEN